MSNRDLEYKIELLQRCSNSEEIAESLESQVSEYLQYCNSDSFAVEDEPYCAPWYIERHVELLDNLREYTECVRTDRKIPDHLLYLVNYCKNIDIE